MAGVRFFLSFYEKILSGVTMAKTVRLSIISLVLLSIVFAGVSFTYSAINENIYSTIRVAYMNGFVDALNLDMDKITRIKGDKALLMEEVARVAAIYEERVRQMNKDQP